MAASDTGLALRRLRWLRGFEQSHFAQRMGVHQATVSRWPTAARGGWSSPSPEGGPSHA